MSEHNDRHFADSDISKLNFLYEEPGLQLKKYWEYRTVLDKQNEITLSAFNQSEKKTEWNNINGV